MPFDSHSLAPCLAPQNSEESGNGEPLCRPRLDSKTKRLETVNVDGRSRRTACTVRTELACARALLDELETVLDMRSEEQTQRDVVLQVADQLARVASTLKSSGSRTNRESRVA